MPASFPFKNLVFQGGGVKAFAYLGALPVLKGYNILPQIERVAGSSAGGLLATLLSFRLDVEKTIDLYKTVDYTMVAQAHEDQEIPAHLPKLLEKEVLRVRGGMEIAARFLRRYGLYANDYAHEWLMGTIAAHCDGNGRATFADFHAAGFRDVYIVVTNISTHSAEVFSAESTPHVAVADAVIMSGSIPFFFEAPQFDGKQLGSGDFYTDGGVLSNYPLHIFDNPRFAKGNRHFENGINWETIGCRLFTPADCQPQNEPILNIIDYIENLFETMADIQEVSFESRLVDQLRTINISNCGVKTTDFNIQADLSDSRYAALVQSGQTATREYLEKYQRSSDKLYAIKEKLAGLLNLWD
jgi:NTE family protein